MLGCADHYVRVGAIRRNFAVLVTFCPLMCLGIIADRCPSTKLRCRTPTELAIGQQLYDSAFPNSAKTITSQGKSVSAYKLSLLITDLSLRCDAVPCVEVRFTPGSAWARMLDCPPTLKVVWPSRVVIELPRVRF
ncbi:hypothetical protein Acr_09g0005540 [Actinidia rufa]|uniref:Uncharacterized protein n=1 Tax=Actinidia rufa TaxID=165716 RepID=A0A7J0F5X0_9ERIC|nr:hypothetical protein Acr_09g0005540 [Actinidia rufa]